MSPLLILSGLSLALAEPPQQEPLFPKMHVFKLDNGLQVVVLPLDTPGLAAVQTWMGVGSRDELQPGTTGYAHFFEHLMFSGTPTLGREAREGRLLELAVDENAWTSDDVTCYHQLMPRESLMEVLGMEADRFAHLALTPEIVAREAGAVQGELRKGRGDPDEILYELLWATAFTTHPYHHTPIGLPEDVAGMSAGYAVAQAFFEDWYRPDHATLIVSGDVDLSEVEAEVRKDWAAWRPAGEPEQPVRPAEPAQTSVRRVHLDWDQGETSPRLSLAWKVPAVSATSVESAAIELLPELLFSRVAPLYRRLVMDEALAWEAYGMAPDRTDPGLFEIDLTLRPGVDFDTAEAIVREEIARLRGAPDLEARVALARARQRRSLLLRLDSPAHTASALGDAMRTAQGDPAALDLALAALSAVDAAAVQAAIDTWLIDSGLTVATLSPTPGSQP